MAAALGVVTGAIAVTAAAEPSPTTPPATAAAAPAPPDAAAANRASPPPASAAPARATAHEVRLYVKIANPEQARATILSALAAAGGYAMLRTDARLELKVPPEGLEALLALVESQGIVMDKQRTRVDRTEDIARLRAQLRSRRELLAKMRGFMEQADAHATAQIEQQLLYMLNEIEVFGGQLRSALDRVAYARVAVDLQWQQSAPMRYVKPPFDWLATVGVEQVIDAFRGE